MGSWNIFLVSLGGTWLLSSHQVAAQDDLLQLGARIPDWGTEAVALGCRDVMNSLWEKDPAWGKSVFSTFQRAVSVKFEIQIQ